MPNVCPDCGAVYTGDLTCRSIFDKFLVLEGTDLGYGRVHMLNVACYMIQHGQYSDDALVWIEQQLRNNLEKGIPQEQIRRSAARMAGQSRRTWKITRRPEDPPQAKIAWSMTIADVAPFADDPERYCQKMKEWARVTLDEMQPLISAMNRSGKAPR